MAELNTLTTLLADSTLKAYYRFESGALTTDTSSGGHTLTAISAPALGTGKYGGCADFTTDDAYSATDHADFKPTGVFSVSFWIKTTSTGANEVLFNSYAFGSSQFAGFYVYMNSTGKIISVSGKNTGSSLGTDYQIITSNTSINDNNWNHVVCLWDGAFLRVYVNGASDATAVAWADAPVYQTTNYVRIGCENNTGSNANFFTGSIDDLAIFNGKALCNAEVQALYKAGLQLLYVTASDSAYLGAGGGKNEAWATLIAEPGGEHVHSNVYVEMTSTSTENQYSTCLRSKIVLDTSALGTGTVDSATLTLQGSAKADAGSWTPGINVYSAGGTSTIANGDYESMGTTAFATAITYANWSTTLRNNFDFNASGIAGISTTGYTLLGMRIPTYDVAGTGPSWGSAKDTYIVANGAEDAGNEPQLIIAYTPGSVSGGNFFSVF